MSASAAEPKDLVFRAKEPGIIPWTLLGFILLSACVHALGFYIFQAIYPPATHMGPPPVQVGLLVPGTPEADAILRWIDSENPEIAAEPTKAPIPGLMSLPYQPSYSVVRAQPVVPQPSPMPLPYPGGASGLDLVQIASAKPSKPLPAPSPAATMLAFSGPLKAIAPALLPALDALKEAQPGELQPARYLLGVSAQGGVQYVFLQDSSGDKALDAGAGRLLEQLRFRAIPGPMTWGYATLYWGSAAYATPAPGEATP
ncbi:MAG TPA: hypothetical protein VHY22_13680 [Chthoniobacteraceae bacterium]|jgi:hypothetical protein|nr:hypothetical protein [Chthoniobacteraceae bacterium]